MRRVAIILLSAAILLGPSAAGASGPSVIVEGGGGLMWGLAAEGTVDSGASANFLFGVGGRPAGSWLRYYFLVEAVTGGYSRTIEQNLRQLELDRSLFEVGLGMRVVAPLVPWLRWFGDLEVVGLNASTEARGSRLLVDEASTLLFGLRGATGLQFRPVARLSASLRFAMTAAFDHFDRDLGAGWLADVDSESSHVEATLQLTVYF